MPLSRSPLLARIAAAGALSVAALALATPAHAYDNRQIPFPEQAASGPGAGHCAKLEIVYVRGTSEPAGKAYALNGTSTNPTVRPEFMPSAVFNLITNDLGNTWAPVFVGGQLVRWEREYVTLYSPQETPENTNPALNGRSDFSFHNLTYPAEPAFINSTSPTNSVQVGTIALVNRLNAEGGRCPNKRFLLFGYSQGSLVIANALSWPNKRKYWFGGATGPELTTSLKNRIVSAGLLADAGFNSTETVTIQGHTEYDRALFGTTQIAAPDTVFDQTYQDLNGRRNAADVPLGVIRGQLENPLYGTYVGLRDAATYYPQFNHSGTQNRIRSYCLAEDFICNRGTPQGAEGHVAYFQKSAPRRNLAAFAVQKLRQADPRWQQYAYGAPGGNAFPRLGLTEPSLIP